MISFYTNNAAEKVSNNLNSHYSKLATATQRLSSGLRINSAADDASGLAVRELMRADITALHQGIRNASDAISMLQIADGALSVIDEKLIRMKELAEQAATGTYDSTQRLMINSEFQAMGEEIDRIARATDFNGIKLLDYDGPKTGSASAAGGTTGTTGGQTTAVKPPENFDWHEKIEGYDVYWNIELDGRSVTELQDEDVHYELMNTYISYTDKDSFSKLEGVNKITFKRQSDGTYKCEDGYTSEVQKTKGTNHSLLIVEADMQNGNALYDEQWYQSRDDYFDDYPQTLTYTITVIDPAAIDEPDTPETPAADTASDIPADKVKIHFGPGNDSAEDYYYIDRWNATRAGLGLDGIKIETQDEAQGALVTINDGIVAKDKIRAEFGAMQNRLENTVSNLSIQAENLQAAESRISDADIAQEMTQFVRNQVLSQAAVAMLAQANSMPQIAMRLIGG